MIQKCLEYSFLVRGILFFFWFGESQYSNVGDVRGQRLQVSTNLCKSLLNPIVFINGENEIPGAVFLVITRCFWTLRANRINIRNETHWTESYRNCQRTTLNDVHDAREIRVFDRELCFRWITDFSLCDTKHRSIAREREKSIFVERPDRSIKRLACIQGHSLERFDISDACARNLSSRLIFLEAKPRTENSIPDFRLISARWNYLRSDSYRRVA